MSINRFENAVDEQLRGLTPMQGISNGSKGKGLTNDQIWRPRRRTETILIEMVDKEQSDSLYRPQSNQNGRKRRRRRGPRVFVANLRQSS